MRVKYAVVSARDPLSGRIFKPPEIEQRSLIDWQRALYRVPSTNTCVELSEAIAAGLVTVRLLDESCRVESVLRESVHFQSKVFSSPNE